MSKNNEVWLDHHGVPSIWFDYQETITNADKIREIIEEVLSEYLETVQAEKGNDENFTMV